MQKIRKAKKEDAAFILQMIKELAKFERAPEKVTLTLEQLTKDGFNAKPLFEALILENSNGQSIGFALYYNRYSTWRGKTLYLEDLYIIPSERGSGLGIKVMEYLRREAIDTGCARFEWQVLDWNSPAIEFYEKLGAELDGEWINCRIEGDALLNG